MSADATLSWVEHRPETNSILIRRQMRIPHRHDQARMAQDLLQRQDVPAVLDEVAAEECRSAWAACPLGSRVVVLASARRNEVIECMNGLCSLQCFTIRFSSSAQIALFAFCPAERDDPLRALVGFNFSASDHRASVAKQISTTGST